MEEFLSLCANDMRCNSSVEDSFVTAPSEISMDRNPDLTGVDSFLSCLVDEKEDDLANIPHNSSNHDDTITCDCEEIVQSSPDEKQLENIVTGSACDAVFDTKPTQRVGVRPKKGLKIIDLKFNPSPKKERASTSERVLLNSDSSDDEMMDRKKYLTENGKSLQKQIEKTAKEKHPFKNFPASPKQITKTLKQTVLSGVGERGACLKSDEFDNFFRLKIRNPKISSTTFECFIDGHRKLRISEIKVNTSVKDSWTTAGVIVNRSVRRSVNGKDYLIWKLHDLKNCQDPPVTLLLFAEACKNFWKLQIGNCVALMTPQIAESEQNGDVRGEGKFRPQHILTLKVFKTVQVIELGFSSDFGYCKGIKLDRQKCNNFVNTSLSEFCIHHVLKEARKLSAKRGTFNSVTSQPPPKRAANFPGHLHRKNLESGSANVYNTSSSSTTTVQPTGSNMIKPLEVKTITRADEMTKLKDIIGGRPHLPGARNMLHLKHTKRKLDGTVQPQVDSMKEFIKKQASPASLRNLLHVPKLGKGLHDSSNVNLKRDSPKQLKVISEDPARLRAIAILKRNKEQAAGNLKKSKKQSQNVIDQQSCERTKLSSIDNCSNLEMLLRKKSLHDCEAEKAEGLAVQKHLDSLEQIEKVETIVSECMEIKNVKVVNCKKCGYTAPKQSDFCMREGHFVTKGMAEKRFFKCSSCRKRIVTYGIMPTKPCKHCDSNKWIRVAMKDERKVMLDNENLLVRGEERKFVNS